MLEFERFCLLLRHFRIQELENSLHNKEQELQNSLKESNKWQEEKAQLEQHLGETSQEKDHLKLKLADFFNHILCFALGSMS